MSKLGELQAPSSPSAGHIRGSWRAKVMAAICLLHNLPMDAFAPEDVGFEDSCAHSSTSVSTVHTATTSRIHRLRPGAPDKVHVVSTGMNSLTNRSTTVPSQNPVPNRSSEVKVPRRASLTKQTPEASDDQPPAKTLYETYKGAGFPHRYQYTFNKEEPDKPLATNKFLDAELLRLRERHREANQPLRAAPRAQPLPLDSLTSHLKKNDEFRDVLLKGLIEAFPSKPPASDSEGPPHADPPKGEAPISSIPLGSPDTPNPPASMSRKASISSTQPGKPVGSLSQQSGSNGLTPLTGDSLSCNRRKKFAATGDSLFSNGPSKESLPRDSLRRSNATGRTSLEPPPLPSCPPPTEEEERLWAA